ncbi:hypothetical protein MRX96_015046 [Rhipicephalus microplus]
MPLVFDPLGGPFVPDLSDCQTMGQSCAAHATLDGESPEGDVLLQELADGKREMLGDSGLATIRGARAASSANPRFLHENEVIAMTEQGVSTSEPRDADVFSPATLGRSGPVWIVMIHRYDVKRVVELMPSEDIDVRDAFGLVLRLPSRTCENLYTLVAEPSASWSEFLSILCQHMGKVYSVPDHTAFMKQMSVQELGLDPSSLQTTLAKALNSPQRSGPNSRVLCESYGPFSLKRAYS